MRFGREDEMQADTLGVRLMKQGGYDPNGMETLMKVLASAGGGHTPEFFSTHPNPENRLQRIKTLVDENGGPGGEVGQQRFAVKVLQRLPVRGVGGSGE